MDAIGPYRQTAPPPIDIAAVANCIESIRLPSGEIPWHLDGKTDPWDHIESVMGLSIAGRFAAAATSLQWLADNQLPDGSWYAAYRQGVPTERTREAHHAAYVAVGLWQYAHLSQDWCLLKRMWPVLDAGIDYALGLQAAGGEIYWARNPSGQIDPMALLTGCCSIVMSLKCALDIADRLGKPRPHWQRGLVRLFEAIGQRPWLFNMTKARFAMDWFYPILCGAVAGGEAKRRLERFWKKFVIEGQGVRCVSDQPWVTVAETAELVLALTAMGNIELARIVFGWIADRRYEDGSYWCGYTFPEMVIWPVEKISWTNAVVMMAADALFGLTPAGSFFSHAHRLQRFLA